MEYSKEFLDGLYSKLHSYVLKQYSTFVETYDWLYSQQLATRGGMKIFDDYCKEIGKPWISERVRNMDWQEFDDWVYELSEKLLNRKYL